MSFRSNARRIAMGLIVLTPFGIAVAAHATPDRAEASPVSKRSALSFGEYLVNLGRLPEGKAALAVFRFANTSDVPLKVLGFSPSCGCLTPKLEKFDYRPGERGHFIVEADTAGEGSDRGDSVKQHYVDVRYDDGTGEKTERVHVKFVLPARRIQIAPRALLIYQGNDQPTTREITITDHRSSPTNITAVECASPIATIETEIAKSPTDSKRATISLTVTNPPIGVVETKVLIHTDDPDQPILYVPLVVQGLQGNGVGAGVLSPAALGANE